MSIHNIKNICYLSLNQFLYRLYLKFCLYYIFISVYIVYNYARVDIVFINLIRFLFNKLNIII